MALLGRRHYNKDVEISCSRNDSLPDLGKRRFSIKLWKTFTDCFNCLPIAALIDEKIFCCHGGLSPDLQNMEQIRRVMRPTDVPDTGWCWDCSRRNFLMIITRSSMWLYWLLNCFFLTYGFWQGNLYVVYIKNLNSLIRIWGQLSFIPKWTSVDSGRKLVKIWTDVLELGRLRSPSLGGLQALCSLSTVAQIHSTSWSPWRNKFRHSFTLLTQLQSVDRYL